MVKNAPAACIAGHFGPSDTDASGARVAAFAEGLHHFGFSVTSIGCTQGGPRAATRPRRYLTYRSVTGERFRTAIALYSFDEPFAGQSHPSAGLLHLARLIAFWVEVVRWLRASPSGTLFLYGIHGPMLAISAVAARLFGRMVVLDVVEWFDHSSRDTIRKRAANVIVKRIVPRLATHASVISEEVCAHLPSALPRTIVPAMISSDWAAAIDSIPARQSRPGNFRCFFSGTERSNLPSLVDALETLAARRPECDIVLQLTAPTVTTTHTAPDSSAIRVELLGLLPRAEYAETIRRSDCLIILGSPGSDKDNAFPNRLPEYLLSGSPTLLSGYPAAARRLRHLEEIYLLESSEPAALLKGLEYCLLEVSGATAMGQRGSEAARRLFSPRTVIGPLILALKDS